jgi:hypothetical protein
MIETDACSDSVLKVICMPNICMRVDDEVAYKVLLEQWKKIELFKTVFMELKAVDVGLLGCNANTLLRIK